MDGNGECNENEQSSGAAGCSDKGSPDETNQTKDVSAENTIVDSEPKESEDAQSKSNNTAQNNNKNKLNRGQKRRQKNNVHRVQGVAIPSLFPVPIVQDNFDLRNVLSGPGAGDVGPWWHRPPQHNFLPPPTNHQSNYQQTKKPRTEPTWKKKTNQNTTVERSDDPIEDILNPLKYVVIPVDYPNSLFNDQQSDLLQELLLDNILNIRDDEPTPRFWRTFLRQGALLLYLADEKSVEWLVKTVPTLTLNEDIKCKTGPAKDLILTRKFNTTIPKLLKDSDEAKILKLLKSQNPGLKCELWQVISSQSDDKGRNMTLAVDEESYKVIRANSFKAHLALGIIKFNNTQPYNITHASNN